MIGVAAILAGGKGTRLKAVVSDRPKPLAEVSGRPFIGYLLSQFAAAGIGQVVLCTGYGAAAMRQTLGDDFGGLALTYSEEQTPLDTGGALRLALEKLGDGPVLVANGDSWCGVDLQAYVDWHLAGGYAASLVGVHKQDAGRYGALRLGEDDIIEGFDEKRPGGGPGWINAGIYLFDRRTIEAMPRGRPLSLEREVFPALVGAGFAAFRTDADFIDIGTPETYAQAADVLP
ncbi:MAG: nucleotidyltransferase family protein [Alphaproteobacteria bacterium]